MTLDIEESVPAETEAETDAQPSGIERRRHPRVSLDSAPDGGATESTDRRQAERRSSDRGTSDRRENDRRSVDAFRAEMQRSTVSNSQNNGRGAKRSALPRRMGMKPSRIALLAVALLSGAMAAYLALPRDQRLAEPAAVAQANVVQEPRMQVLIAKEPIGLGQRLSASSMAWEDWPEGSVRADYITAVASPEAISDISGSVARYEIFPGEPIREDKLSISGRGYLSAVLSEGMRGVSVSVAAESASGGFIVPNDHVDVVVTRESDFGRDSETILRNVRVLAINTRLGETGKTGEGADPENPRAQMFANQAIATIELDPMQAEVIINAAAGGQLSLALLSVDDIAKTNDQDIGTANAAIRVSSPFWMN